MSRRRAYVTVDVDVYLDEFDSKSLQSELESRGISVASESINEIYYALKFEQNERAIQLMRKYICDATGKTL